MDEGEENDPLWVLWGQWLVWRVRCVSWGITADDRKGIQKEDERGEGEEEEEEEEVSDKWPRGWDEMRHDKNINQIWKVYV